MILEMAMGSRSLIPRREFFHYGMGMGKFLPPLGCKREKNSSLTGKRGRGSIAHPHSLDNFVCVIVNDKNK
jgi:hypothetical protein